MKTVLLQSHHPPPRPAWLDLCLETAANWAAARGFKRIFLHDELFDGLPPAFLAATEGEVLPRTDLGRLRWMRRLHDEEWDRVVWLDADVLIFDPTLAFGGDAIGREAWIGRGAAGGYRVLRKVNNCVLCFDAGSPHFERYLAAAEARAATFARGPGRMALGPDLLSELHARAPFPLHPDVAMFSPLTLGAVVDGDAAPLDLHCELWGGAPKAANLCASLADDADMMVGAARKLLDGAASGDPMAAPRFEEVRAWKGAPRIW